MMEVSLHDDGTRPDTSSACIQDMMVGEPRPRQYGDSHRICADEEYRGGGVDNG